MKGRLTIRTGTNRGRHWGSIVIVSGQTVQGTRSPDSNNVERTCFRSLTWSEAQDARDPTCGTDEHAANGTPRKPADRVHETAVVGHARPAAPAAQPAGRGAHWPDRDAAVSVSLSVFFFSSRRRHTRLQGDWSSDVCSSD